MVFNNTEEGKGVPPGVGRHVLYGPAAGIAHDKIVPHTQMIWLYRLECINRRSLGLANHLNVGPLPHARPLRRLQRRVLRSIGPHGRARQHELDPRRRHEALAVPPRQRVHGVRVHLGEVIGHGVDDGAAHALELRGGLEGGDVKGELLGAVEEELNAAEAGLLGAELEAPFYGGGGGRGGGGGGGGRGAWGCVGEFCGDLVGGYAVAARPGLDYFDVVWRRRVDGGDAIES